MEKIKPFRDPKRIKRIMGMIQKYWTKAPDLRFGQMLINIGMIPDSQLMWHMEDDKWEEYLKGVVKNRRS